MKLTLRQWRMLRDMTLKEASKKIGVSEQAINNWEKHGALPNARQIPAIEEAYGIRWSDDVLMPKQLNLIEQQLKERGMI